jgi:hypothetical protein
VKTSFVPASYKGRPEEAAAAILTGQELGLSPLAALRSIDIINGVPAMRAVALRALVQSSGHEMWTEESTATQAIVAGRRKGSDKVERSVWTMDRARGLQLVSKDNWKKQPIAMLLARATSELVRLIAADVILGIPYSAEEIWDQAPVEVSDVSVVDAVPKRSVRTAKRKQLDEPKVEERAAEAEVAEAVSDLEIGTLRGDGVIEPVDVVEPDESASARPTEPEEAAAFDEDVSGYVEESRAERLSLPEDPLSPTPEEEAEWASLEGEFGDE